MAYERCLSGVGSFLDLVENTVDESSLWEQFDEVIRQVTDLFRQQPFEQAIPRAEQARTFAVRHWGRQHPNYGTIACNLRKCTMCGGGMATPSRYTWNHSNGDTSSNSTVHKTVCVSFKRGDD